MTNGFSIRQLFFAPVGTGNIAISFEDAINSRMANVIPKMFEVSLDLESFGRQGKEARIRDIIDGS